MTPEAILARERERALPVAIAAFASVAAFILAIVVNQGGSLGSADTDAQFLADFDDNSGSLLLTAIFQALGMVLLIAPLFYLFQAAAARSDTMRPALVGITVAGPLFLAIGSLLQWYAFDQAAADFATPGGGLGVPVGEYAEDLIRDQAAFDAAQGFTFAGTLGLVVAIVYTAVHAMRTGLLTRFWGTLGMALGVSLLFLGPIGVMAFVIAMGLLIAGRWPGGRPPAWETGTAMPWPKPGEEPAPEEPDPAAAGANPANRSLEQREPPESSQPPPRKRKRRR